MDNCKYALPVKDKVSGNTARVCTILGEKCSQDPVYVDGQFMGNICDFYDKEGCKDKKIRD